MKIGAETKTIDNKRQGDLKLTLTYRPHCYTAHEQAEFEDNFAAADKTCGECGAKLSLEEMTQSERDANLARKKATTNGHAMLERSVVCDQCGKRANPRQQQSRLMAQWLADNLVDADFEDKDGSMIPIDPDSLYRRLPFEVMMEAFTMVVEDKAGKGSRAR